MDVDCEHHEQSVEIENMQRTLYSLGIKSPFILNLKKVEDLNELYLAVMSIMTFDKGAYMMYKINSTRYYCDVINLLNRLKQQKEGKQKL